ncbi:MAG: SRPBCC family protein [Gammaproteobacteria bacterium]|nr:SRPBCC family protein [Gammaproteobacteria bacterium]
MIKNISISRVVNASKTATWAIISDVAGYAKYAPNIDNSKILSGQGKGMIRECSNKDGNWREIYTAWQPEHYYDFEIETQKKGYPYPFKLLTGHWEVKPKGDNKTLITMNFDYEFKNKLLGFMIGPMMRRQFIKACQTLLDNWEKSVITTA